MFLLSVRSYYSLMRGCSSPDKICARTRELGFSGIALTDYNSLSGIWEFLAACKKYSLCPVIGVELSDTASGLSLICLVRNYNGYVNLCNWITILKKGCNFSLLTFERLDSDGLFILSSSLALLQMLKANSMEIVADLGNKPTEQGGELRRWAKENNITAVATASAMMASREERDLFSIMQAIRQNCHFDASAGQDEDPSFLETRETYGNRFSVWPEVLPATELLAERCHFRGPEFGLVMPPWQEGSNDTVTLRKKAYTGACTRYGDDLSEAVVERLEHELKIIDSMGFSSYFLVVRDIVHNSFARSADAVPRICGRGSGAASLVAYCLEITNVCPLKHNLYFERFLNPGRSDAPDIDIDFAWDERDAILDRVLQKYKGHAAMVATIIRFQPRMAIRETAKTFGLAAGEISSHIKMLRRNVPGTSDLPEPWPQIMQLAAQLVNIPRHISVHPGGVVITPKPLHHYVPVEMAAKGVPIIQWDKDSAEEAGLVKIDLLGNRSLGVIRDCIQSISTRGRNFDEEYWHPEEDEATQKNIAAGKTMGCFYIESPAMRLLQQKAGSGDFEQLVLQSSIIRPAANEFVREYVRRLHGGAWQHLHQSLRNVLDETYGLMVYQEDVSRVAVAVAGFTHVQADGLRKVMSKKDKVLRLQDYHDRFDAGCKANGVASDIRKKLWQMMMSFDGYSFCKAHSASYARVSYQAAYLKTHYPAEFMAAVISNQGGYYPTFAYVSEAKRLGIKIHPPCVNGSGLRWEGEQRNIRVGLLSIRDLSQKSMINIIQKRKDGLYQSSIDFWQRVPLQKDESRALIQAGALDSFVENDNRGKLFWELAQFRYAGEMQKSSSLFDFTLPPAPELPDISRLQRLRQEYQILGFLCDEHPILLHGDALNGRTKGVDIPAQSGKQVAFAGWLISGKIVSTKTGEAMEFLTFEDETALVETVFFPKVYRRYATRLSTGRAYMLWGIVEEEFGTTTLTVSKLRPL
jgi:DNA-directed DNA polymerase III PolC